MPNTINPNFDPITATLSALASSGAVQAMATSLQQQATVDRREWQRVPRPAMFASREAVALAAYRKAELLARAVIERAGGDPDNDTHLVAYMDAINPYDKQETPGDHAWADADVVEHLRVRFLPTEQNCSADINDPQADEECVPSRAASSATTAERNGGTVDIGTEERQNVKFAGSACKTAKPKTNSATDKNDDLPSSPLQQAGQQSSGASIDHAGFAVEQEGDVPVSILDAYVRAHLPEFCVFYNRREKLLPGYLHAHFFRNEEKVTLTEFKHENSICMEGRTLDGRYSYPIREKIRWPSAKRKMRSDQPGIFTTADLKTLRAKRRAAERKKPQPVAPIGRQLSTGDMVPELWDRKPTKPRAIPLNSEAAERVVSAQPVFRTSDLTEAQRKRREELLDGKPLNSNKYDRFRHRVKITNDRLFTQNDLSETQKAKRFARLAPANVDAGSADEDPAT